MCNNHANNFPNSCGVEFAFTCRVYGGIHFQKSVLDGTQLGIKVSFLLNSNLSCNSSGKKYCSLCSKQTKEVISSRNQNPVVYVVEKNSYLKLNHWNQIFLDKSSNWAGRGVCSRSFRGGIWYNLTASNWSRPSSIRKDFSSSHLVSAKSAQ